MEATERYTLAEQVVLLQHFIRENEKYVTKEVVLLSYYTPRKLTTKYLDRLFKPILTSIRNISQSFYKAYGRPVYYCNSCGFETQSNDRRRHHKKCEHTEMFILANIVWPKYFQISDLNDDTYLVKILPRLDLYKIFKFKIKKHEESTYFAGRDVMKHTERLREKILDNDYNSI